MTQLLGINCLMQNTQLYKDLSDFVKKIMLDRIAKGRDTGIYAVYKDARDGHFFDVDMNTVGEIYKDVAASVSGSVGKGLLDSDKQVDKITGKTINEAIKKIISKKRTKTLDEVGQQKPSQSIATDILKLFTSDFIDEKDKVQKTVMKEMQDAIKKAAVSIIEREGKKVTKQSFEDILDEALRLDELSVTDLKGQLNTMDDLFNQLADELDVVITKMEASKKSMTAAKKQEIDEHIEQMKAYRENIVQGAYTLALSRGERKQVLRDILKKKYGKDVVVNGQKKRVLDWNKMFKGDGNFEKDVADVLHGSGFSDVQIPKIIAALQTEFKALKTSAQWQNIASGGALKAVNDDAFLNRVVANVVMSKKDKNGNYYKKFDADTERYIPDYEKWVADNGKTVDQFKEEIKQEILTNGNASQYRQMVSELARANNPVRHISKGDLEKLSDLRDKKGFESNFNAKVYKILGLSDEDTEAGKKVEELTGKVKQLLDDGAGQGNQKNSKLALGKILDDINYIMSKVQNKKNGLLRFARFLEWAMGNRNAFRLLSVYNVMENNLSGASQITQAAFQSMSPDVAKKELSKMLTVMKDISLGGKHFDATDIDKLTYNSHEYRVDPSKSLTHNIKAALAFLPNVALGAMDSAAHSYTMRIMFYNSAVKYRISDLKTKKVDELTKQGLTKEEASELVNKKESQEKIKKQAIDEVTNQLYDEQKEKDALEQAEKNLRLVSNEVLPSEIKREAANIMVDNMVKSGLLSQSKLDALLKASDTAAKKTVGKQAAVEWLPTEWLAKANTGARDRIKKDIQSGNLNSAAMRIMGNAIVMKGIFPFVRGAANWGVITAKKAGLGFLRAIPYTKKSFKAQVEDAANKTPAELEKIMESYHSRRNDIYTGFNGLVFTAIIMGALAGIKAAGGDDDENMKEFIDGEMQKLANDGRTKRMITRWSPPLLHTYNILNENIKGKILDNTMQFFGFDVLNNPLEKARKYNSKHPGASIGSIFGSIFDIGSYYNAFNSYADLSGEEQTDKPQSHSTAAGDWLGTDSDFINGILSGMAGYNLNQDINNWMDFTPSK